MQKSVDLLKIGCIMLTIFVIKQRKTTGVRSGI